MGNKVVLMILDGYGITENQEANAIFEAKKPNLDKLMKECPYALGEASGLDVGLPEGQMSSSEVGHLNIGAGRIVYQELPRITKSITDGDFFDKEEFKKAIDNCKANNSSLHLYGLLSNGGVHSHNTHLYALLELAKRNKLEKVYVHAFLDGRDTAPTSGKGFLEELEAKMKEIGVGKIATVAGRYYALDRESRWERVDQAYNALALGEGEQASSVLECINNSYAKEVHDEFVLPTVIMENGKPVATIQNNDSVIFYNFRPDRAREITRAFCDDDFGGFVRKTGRIKVTYVCFTEYDINIKNTLIAFKNEGCHNTIGEYLSNIGKTQLRLAESTKYAHVTFFLNGGREEPFKNEDRILVDSPKVATFDLQPEMSANEVCDKLVESIKSQEYDLIIMNFANCDMVGHSGKMDATISAVETIDACVGRAVEAAKETATTIFICADHGNADQMIDYETKETFTAHTLNPVPFIIVNCPEAKGIKNGGRLSDIAPTLLDIMGLDQPKEMTGKSLLIK